MSRDGLHGLEGADETMASKRTDGIIAHTQSVVRSPEVLFTLAIVAITALFSVTLDLPFHTPSGDRAAFVGIHYLYPLAGLIVWGVIAAYGQRTNLLRTFVVALPCYAIVLICHFNIKLWAPHINPVLWDDLYWMTDQAMRPLVEASFALRRWMEPVIPTEGNFYVVGYILMFYISFCYHALATPTKFRRLFLAALFLQGMGTLAYLAMPALGPFLYEAGVEARPTAAQASMLAAYYENVAGGSDWLRENGGTHLTVGLAAMPSLHSAASFLFLLFAWKHGRVLVLPYVLIVGYIMIAAIATRWHYIIDLPVGMAIAWASYVAASRFTRDEETKPLASAPPEFVSAPEREALA